MIKHTAPQRTARAAAVGGVGAAAAAAAAHARHAAVPPEQRAHLRYPRNLTFGGTVMLKNSVDSSQSPPPAVLLHDDCSRKFPVRRYNSLLRSQLTSAHRTRDQPCTLISPAALNSEVGRQRVTVRGRTSIHRQWRSRRYIVRLAMRNEIRSKLRTPNTPTTVFSMPAQAVPREVPGPRVIGVTSSPPQKVRTELPGRSEARPSVTTSLGQGLPSNRPPT